MKNLRGKMGEDIAANYLVKLGYEIIHRNFRSSFGEIDIIALDKKNKATVFVEVRTKSNTLFGRAEESLTTTKKRRLLKTAQFFISIHQVENYRFDLIAINLSDESPIQHFKNIL